MSGVPFPLLALKTLNLVLGGVITYFAFKAYRRTLSRALGLLSLGFGIVTLGALVAGVVDQFASVSNDYALILESLLTAVGFAVILYSLYQE